MFAAVAAKRASNDTTTSLDFVIPGELLLVLGISLSSTVIATAIKAVKDSRDAGTIKRGLAPAARTSDSDPELKPFFFQVFLQEDGAMADKVVDVAKFQNFCLTVALWVGYVAVGGAFLRQGELKALPGFTDQFVTLLAISHGTYLAGKLPVVLNWTTGPNSLGHAAKLMGLTHVVTSKAFVDRTQVVVPGTEYVFLEHLRAGMGKFELLTRLLRVRYLPGRTKAKLLARAGATPHAPAVVLFTSGSEKAPKAVPLTHDNILTVQRGIVAVAQIPRGETLLGFLPLFHSFGMTVTGLLPLVIGMKVVHHPDPTDAAALARKVAAYKTGLVAGTPTFLSYIIDRAKPGDLDSIRLLVVGAEKCPQSLFDAVNRLAPQAQVLEGYGITECAPVVSVNWPGKVKPGTVGDPLPGVEVCVADMETHAVLPRGQMGMLHVAGPSVFPGYLGADAPDPFRVIDGKKWYVTGDLAALDETGAIVFHGRLKRFLKAGGEMISLPALEEPFARRFPPTDNGPRVAVEGTDHDGGRKIVLFTTEPLTLREANAILVEEGFRGVLRLDEVRRLDALPVLGTGKTDYKLLRAQLG